MRSSIFTSSKKLKGTKGYSTPLEYFRFWDFFSKQNFPKGSPLQFFLEISDRTDVEKSQRVPPFQFFRHCETSRNFFNQKCPSFNFFWFATEWMKNLKVFHLVRQFGSTFGFFRYRRREYFDTLKSFCCFWALDMAPTWAVPGLFFSSDYNPHTDRSTFLTILTILKSYNCYLANLKYWRKSLRSSIFTSSKKLKGTKGYALLRVFSALWDFFFEKIFNVSKRPLFEFSHVLQLNVC